VADPKLENDLALWKSVMYGTLSFFLTGSGFVAFLAAAWSFLCLILFLVLLLFLYNLDPELIKVILHYFSPRLFPMP
jgi:hypothetical protein